MDFFEGGRDKPWLESMTNRSLFLETQIERNEKRFGRLEREFILLKSITMDIIGKSPEEQRDNVGPHYKRYVSQNEFPDIRDIVEALLKIP